MYLLDSNFLIDFLNNRNGAVDIMAEFDHSEVGTSVICIAEVLEGLAPKKLILFNEFVGEIKVYAVNIETAVVFASIRKSLRRSGNLIENMDLLIAATCMANDLILVTGNKRHFERIIGLKML